MHVTTVVLLLRGMSHIHTIYLSIAHVRISTVFFSLSNWYMLEPLLNGFNSIVLQIPTTLCNLVLSTSFQELLG